MLAPYDSWADYYDLTDADREPFVSFYATLLKPDTRAVLELGCGTGTILVALAGQLKRRERRLGLCLVGLDQSYQMLRHAKRKSSHCHWVCGDLEAPPVHVLFDLIVCCFNTLQHLTSFESVVKALTANRELLAPGGVLAFDVYNPNADYLQTPLRNRMARAVTDRDGCRLEIRENTQYDAATESLSIDWQLIDCTSPEQTSLARTQYRMRQYWPNQLEKALKLAGLNLLTRFGDFDGRSFAQDSKRQVLLCQAT